MDNVTLISLENAKNSDIPQSYILITNNEIVRPRYILMYGSKKSIAKKPTVKTVHVPEVPRTGLLNWVRRNPMIVSVVLYVSQFQLYSTQLIINPLGDVVISCGDEQEPSR